MQGTQIDDPTDEDLIRGNQLGYKSLAAVKHAFDNLSPLNNDERYEPYCTHRIYWIPADQEPLTYTLCPGWPERRIPTTYEHLGGAMGIQSYRYEEAVDDVWATDINWDALIPVN